MKLTREERLQFSRLPQICNDLDKDKNCISYTISKIYDCASVNAIYYTGYVEYFLKKNGEILFSGRFKESQVPEKYDVWKGRGYTGGHTSQSHWDTMQESREIGRLVSLGYSGIDQTKEGNTSGYYPEVWYWKN